MLRVIKALIEETRLLVTQEKLIEVCHDLVGAAMKPRAGEVPADAEKLLAPGISIAMLRATPGFWRSEEIMDIIIGSTAARMTQMVMRSSVMAYVDNDEELHMVATCLNGLQETALPVLMRELAERYGDVEPDDDQIQDMLIGIKIAVLRQMMEMRGEQADEPAVSQSFDGNNVVAFPAPRTLQ